MKTPNLLLVMLLELYNKAGHVNLLCFFKGHMTSFTLSCSRFFFSSQNTATRLGTLLLGGLCMLDLSIAG